LGSNQAIYCWSQFNESLVYKKDQEVDIRFWEGSHAKHVEGTFKSITMNLHLWVLLKLFLTLKPF
jgi:hypothetical protein